MRLPSKWAALAIAHLVVLSGLTVGVILIAVRLGPPAAQANAIANLFPGIPLSDVEIARLNLLSARIAVMQANLANADTVGFKRQLIDVEEGSPPRISEYRLDMRQGGLEQTSQSNDLAIQGEGFFHVKIQSTIADGTGYTRNGMLRRNKHGELLVAIGDGYPLIPPLHIPVDATDIAVEQDGTVTYHTPATAGRTSSGGRISLCRFADSTALGRTNGLFTETVESGPPVVGNPGSEGMGQVLQGYLESSNVDPLKEWAALLRAQQMMQFSSPARQVSLPAGIWSPASAR